MLGEMRGARRLVSALVLTGLATLGVAERAALHRHPLDENDLAPHQLVVVEAGEACGGRAHLDAGTLADHPVCSECVLAASALALAPSAVARLAGADELGELAAPPARLVPTARPRSAGARGPPRA
jgi:hypothetical protein